jgi:5-methylthioadenosine/S-adenosylhomocysteine deaminase
VSFPLLNLYGHVGKSAHRLIGADLGAVRRTVHATVEHLRSTRGEDTWARGMNPDLPSDELLDNPCTYTGHRSASTHDARGSVFGSDEMAG